MRRIDSKLIKKAVKDLCIKANTQLRGDVYLALKRLRKKEKSLKAKMVLDTLIKNADIAKKKKLPICQDTGMVVVYLKIGQGVSIKGDISKAIKDGVREAYKEGYFRKSVVKDPFIRKNTSTNLPPIIYTGITSGSKLEIRVAIKGFGCENASATKMFRPTDPMGSVEKFIVDQMKKLGSKACPPMYIGIGIGGTLDKAVSLSKEAIFRPAGKGSSFPHIRKLEKSILKKINDLKIGPMGVGGRSTVFNVSINTYPTHIAGLPVALSVSCHATRDASRIL
ncbi:MAG: fumarate hydratase [Candidatus Omnitrophota bacterium]